MTAFSIFRLNGNFFGLSMDAGKQDRCWKETKLKARYAGLQFSIQISLLELGGVLHLDWLVTIMLLDKHKKQKSPTFTNPLIKVKPYMTQYVLIQLKSQAKKYSQYQITTV
eukprot:TRINITY_DN35152_c0_g1_i1.p1 TRINITY_DN35152_c0_g1~~TRINITY_DN35152_c0_g1_i1.p1  ORF type:complete len:111 (+),score=1.51 TRINITY_DN35152_c0_g1_i1:120-452(+)